MSLRSDAKAARREAILRACMVPCNINELTQVQGLNVSTMTLYRDVNELVSEQKLRVIGNKSSVNKDGSRNYGVAYCSIGINPIPMFRNKRGMRYSVLDLIENANAHNWDRNNFASGVDAFRTLTDILMLAVDYRENTIDTKQASSALNEYHSILDDLRARLADAAYVIEQAFDTPELWDISALSDLMDSDGMWEHAKIRQVHAAATETLKR